jgi:hypothetical protein
MEDDWLNDSIYTKQAYDDFLKSYSKPKKELNTISNKFFIYAVTKTSVKRYFVNNDCILPLYGKVDTIIRTSTNQKCVFLDNGTSFLWEDIDELTQNLEA